jgi:hypothetical protein
MTVLRRTAFSIIFPGLLVVGFHPNAAAQLPDTNIPGAVPSGTVRLEAAVQGPRQLTVPEEIPPPNIVPEGTVIPITLVSEISTRTAEEGDGVYARTVFPITANNQIVIPVDSYVRGRVVRAERAGRVTGRAELTLSFQTLILPSGLSVPLYASLAGIGNTLAEQLGESTVEGEATKGEDAGTITTRAGTGAGVGAIAGRSAAGAGVGAAVGAAAGLGQVLLTRGADVVLPPGTTIEIMLDRDLEP